MESAIFACLTPESSFQFGGEVWQQEEKKGFFQSGVVGKLSKLVTRVVTADLDLVDNNSEKT